MALGVELVPVKRHIFHKTPCGFKIVKSKDTSLCKRSKSSSNALQSLPRTWWGLCCPSCVVPPRRRESP